MGTIHQSAVQQFMSSQLDTALGWQKLLACINTLSVLKRYGQLDVLLQMLGAF